MFTKSKIALITILIVFSISIVFAIFPYFNLKEAVFGNQDRKEELEIVVTRFDLFNPRFSIIIPLHMNTHWVIVDDFERVGINQFKAKNIDIFTTGFEAISAEINNKSLDEVKQIVSEYDLSEVNPDPDNILSNAKPVQTKETILLEEAQKPENRYFDEIGVRRGEFLNYNPDRVIDDFKELQVGYNYYDIKNSVGFGEQGDSNGLATGMYESKYLIDKANINFIVLAYNERFSDIKTGQVNDSAELQKIVIVTTDRKFVEVPINPNGTFDFESALEIIG